MDATEAVSHTKMTRSSLASGLQEFQNDFMDLDISRKDSFWQKYATARNTNVFSEFSVRISQDGGMSDVARLLYGTQYFYAFSRLVGVLVNTYAIAIVDLPAVVNTWHKDATTTVLSGDAKDYLVTAHLACAFAHCDSTESEQVMEAKFHNLIPLFELAYLSWNIAWFVGLGIGAMLVPYLKTCRFIGSAKRAELLRWSYVETCFFHYFVELRAYSALKLLYYITPTVLTTQAYTRIVHAWQTSKSKVQAMKACLDVAFFVASRLACLMVGFDAFLVKFRLTAQYVERTQMNMNCLLVAATFLFQLLGTVKLNTFIRERLHIFMFAGEDGQLDYADQLLSDVWSALLVRSIYKTFGVVKGTIVMLGFDDYDMQMLVLEDRKQDIQRQASATSSKLDKNAPSPWSQLPS